MSTWVVVGANRGIGLELTRHLVRRPGTNRVVAACRTRTPELDALRVEVVEGVDVTSEEGVGKLAEHLGGGAVDALVVMSGVLRPVSLEALDFDVVREQLETNALGPLRVVSRLLPNLVAAGQGAKVALITSRMGSIADNGSGDHYGYRMSKAALNMAGKSLSIDLKGRGVAVCLLHPGFVRTRMTGGHGNVEPDVAAGQLLARIDDLAIETTGTFWHADGSVLPW